MRLRDDASIDRPDRRPIPRLALLAEAARQMDRFRREAADRERRGVIECSYCRAETPRDAPRCVGCGHDPDEIPF